MPKALVRGASLHYELSGKAGVGGDSVVLLNGIAMSIGNWRPVTEALVASGRRVLCHDFRGQMLSQKRVGPYSLRGHAEDLAALMDQLGIESADIIGTSYGGEVALEFALAFPAKTASLAVVDSVSFADPMLVAAVEGWKACALADPVAFYRSIIAWNYSAEYIGSNRELLARRETAMASLPRAWFEDFAELCDAFLVIDLKGRLGPIAAPTLVVWAEKDILKGESYSRSLAAEIAGARLSMIGGSGHAVAMERPEALAALLEGFLKEAATGRGPSRRG
ncbi:MAG TPA: alpha/beta fold hydrolase [Rectinemataceae bacterium]|nr:alpha/beta fold hydrolase [Rectinemataceae bacterium]